MPITTRVSNTSDSTELDDRRTDGDLGNKIIGLEEEVKSLKLEKEAGAAKLVEVKEEFAKANVTINKLKDRIQELEDEVESLKRKNTSKPRKKTSAEEPVGKLLLNTSILFVRH